MGWGGGGANEVSIFDVACAQVQGLWVPLRIFLCLRIKD